MSYEGGDFTWEMEYTGNHTVWPVPEATQVGDNFNNIHKIKTPVLFLHGNDDDICPLSQSRIGFNILRTTGVPTQLVGYAGEKHGFVKKENRQDRDRRVLAWFSKYIPTQ